MAEDKKKSSNSREADRVSMRLPCHLSVGHGLAGDVVRRPASGSGCYLVNLSDKGMQISTNLLIREDVKLNAGLGFDKEKRTVDFTFKVKWLRKNSFKTFGSYSYGLEFLEIKDEDRDFLHRIYDREKRNLDEKTIVKE